jgi:RNA polymerase sigma-70 factor (ECF subfamily)
VDVPGSSRAEPEPLQAFLDAVDLDEASAGDLAPAVAELLAAARQAHPDLFSAVAPADLMCHVARVLPVGDDGGLAEALKGLRAGDLLLAFACSVGNDAALRRFEADVIPALVAPLKRMRLSPHQQEEVEQIIRHRLFVAPEGKSPKILAYAGRGPLTAWLRIVGVREALALINKAKKEPGVFEEDVWAALPSPGDDLEIDYLKKRHRDQFKQAFRDASKNLDSRQRLLLRHSFLDGLTMDEIARIFGVHRKTISRWLAAARQQLLSETRKLLQERLAVDRWELDSLLRQLDSQLEISIPSVLLSDEVSKGPKD